VTFSTSLSYFEPNDLCNNITIHNLKALVYMTRIIELLKKKMTPIWCSDNLKAAKTSQAIVVCMNPATRLLACIERLSNPK